MVRYNIALLESLYWQLFRNGSTLLPGIFPNHHGFTVDYFAEALRALRTHKSPQHSMDTSILEVS